MEKEKEEMREKMEKENQDLREKLAGESNLLKGNIDQNQNQATKRINELAEKLAGMIKGGDIAIKDLTARCFFCIFIMARLISFFSKDAEGE